MGLRGPGAKGRGRPKLLGRKRGRPKTNFTGSLAEQIIAFSEQLIVTSGKFAGKPLQLRDWQKQIVRAIYAERNGDRPIRTALITMPRKNGKTQLAAALALCHMCGPVAEQRGQVYSAAADLIQASLIFSEIEAFIMADPGLQERCNVQRFAKKIEVLNGAGAGTIYRALTSDARKAHGLSPSFAIYDELAQAPDRNLYDNLRTGTGAREHPLFVVISTQSADPNHVMSEMVDYGEQVLRDEVDDPHFYAFIKAAPKDADPWNEAVWYDCNPALGDFRNLEDLRIQAAKAKIVLSEEPTFRNHFLNQRIDVTATPWIGREPIEASLMTLDLDQFIGRECYLAADLGGKHDLTALALAFPDGKGGADCFIRYWTPRDTLKEREDRDRSPYREWCATGHAMAVPGKSIDYAYVAVQLDEIIGCYHVLELAFDRWRIDDLKRELDEAGIESFIDDGKAIQVGLKMVNFGQGFKDFSPALDVLETALINGKLRIQRNPITLNHASNCAIEIDAAGNRKFTKRKSTGRIDGMVALAMAVKRALTATTEQDSIYETIARDHATAAAKKTLNDLPSANSSIYEQIARDRTNESDHRRGGWHDDD